VGPDSDWVGWKKEPTKEIEERKKGGVSHGKKGTKRTTGVYVQTWQLKDNHQRRVGKKTGGKKKAHGKKRGRRPKLQPHPYSNYHGRRESRKTPDGK